MDALEKLLYLTGVAAEYQDYGGQRREIPRGERLRALRAMGFVTDSPELVAAAVRELDAEPWRRALRPWYVELAGDEVAVSVHSHPAQLGESGHWRLCLESGERREGRSLLGELAEVGEYWIGELRYTARRLVLGTVPPGYHRLHLSVAGTEHRAELMACPPLAWEIDPEQRLWGVSCQLYTLRSHRNWGVGDFADLRELIGLLAPEGADLVGLNPLHAPCSGSADAASPYSPSDRRFLNPIYLDPAAIPDWDESAARGRPLLTAAREARRERLCEMALVDYPAVNRLKYELFEALYDHFRDRHLALDSPRARNFVAFCHQQGEALTEFSAYEVAHNPHPQRFREDPAFYRYLQWQGHLQLAACQQFALDRGMRIGLMRDLAVGAVGQGSEVHHNRADYAPGVTVGAPPDPFAPQGQDWGLPAPNPVAMRAQSFSHYVELLRRNMQAAGALRIDHAMALMRLWWCLPSEGDAVRSGLYVYYPLRELMALLRLESHRNHCLVVGEDMGVVPEDFRQQLHASHIYGNRLLYFDTHPDGRQRLPWEQLPDTLTMVTNHDVPTLADWWAGTDLLRRRELGLLGDADDVARAQQQRRQDKLRLLDWLAASGVLPGNGSGPDPEQHFDLDLCCALHRACARGASRLLLLQLEDLQLLREPVNIPGTYREYPNWRRKQARPTGELLNDHAVRALLAAVNQERRS
jgi:4-alpha-glucanotransferase